MWCKVLSFLCTLLALSFGYQFGAGDRKSTDLSHLICHTNHVSECYPRTFEATDSFQIVHDDQDLPPGLHVRIDLQTGKKEAKRNFPDEKSDAIAERLDLAVVKGQESVIDKEPLSVQDNSQKNFLSNPRSDHGVIRPSPVNAGESSTFTTSRNILNRVGPADPKILLSALETLEDLSHDIYWGLKLVDDAQTVRTLINFLQFNTSDPSTRGAALLLFGTALQNNPTAIQTALSHCYNEKIPTGPLEAVIVALTHEQLPSLLTRFIYVLSSLCQDQAQLWKFVNQEGLDLLTTVFDPNHAGQDGKDKVRGKIANFVSDHFLQSDSFKKRENETVVLPDGDLHSHLAHEDPWIMSNAYEEGIYDWPRQNSVQPKYRHMAQTLQPWCSVFSKSLSVWAEKDDKRNEAAAVENVKAAQEVLEKQLVAFGCGCDGECYREAEKEL